MKSGHQESGDVRAVRQAGIAVEALTMATAGVTAAEVVEAAPAALRAQIVARVLAWPMA